MDMFIKLLSFVLSFVLFFVLSFVIPIQCGHERWSGLKKVPKGLLFSRAGLILSQMETTLLSNRVNVTRVCREEVLRLSQDFEKDREWAVRMVDSWPRINPGLLSHEFGNYGSYDHCVKVEGSKYCLFKLHWHLPLDNPESVPLTRNGSHWINSIARNYRHLYLHPPVEGFCFPSSCSGHEMQLILSDVFSSLSSPLKIEVYPECDHDPSLDFPPSKIFSISVILILLVVTFTSTIICLTFGSEKLPSMLKHFDATDHSRKLLYGARNEESERLQIVNGARVTYLCLTVFVHIYYTQIAYTPSFYGVNFFNEKISGRTNSILSAFTNFTSVNFILGAFLSYYSWHPEMVKRNGSIRLFPFLLGRWLRTTPMIVFTLLLVFAFPATLGSGPVFNIGLNNVTANCFLNWFSELAYYSNQNKAVYACLPHAWYLGADFQLYVLSLPLLLLIYNRPRRGLTATALIALFVGPLAQMYNFLSFNSGVNWSLTHPDLPKMGAESHVLHFFMSNYITTYCLGLILGYLIVNKVMIESKLKLLAGWTISVTSFFAAFYISLDLKVRTGEDRLFQVFLGSLLKPLISVFFTWLIYVCWMNKASFYGYHLKSSWFLPLGRISYSAFMIHYLFVWYESFTLRNQLEYTTTSMLNRVVSTVISSYILGYFAYLLCEAPFMSIVKSIFIPKKK